MGILEIVIVFINDKHLEKCRDAENKNGHKEEKVAGGDVKMIHGLLKIKQTADNHSNTGYENEIEHHAAYNLIFNDKLAILASFRKKLGIFAVFVENVNVNRNLKHCVTHGVGQKTIQGLGFAA